MGKEGTVTIDYASLCIGFFLCLVHTGKVYIYSGHRLEKMKRGIRMYVKHLVSIIYILNIYSNVYCLCLGGDMEPCARSAFHFPLILLTRCATQS